MSKINSHFISRWLRTAVRYAVILLGIYISAKVAAGLIVMGVTDLGLTRTAPTFLLGIGILGIDLVLILYLVLTLASKAYHRFRIANYAVLGGLAVSVGVTLWASRGIDNCLQGDVLVLCAANSLVWKILGLVIGSVVFLQWDRKRKM